MRWLVRSPCRYFIFLALVGTLLTFVLRDDDASAYLAPNIARIKNANAVAGGGLMVSHPRRRERDALEADGRRRASEGGECGHDLLPAKTCLRRRGPRTARPRRIQFAAFSSRLATVSTMSCCTVASTGLNTSTKKKRAA
jgi:hypothetical protein